MRSNCRCLMGVAFPRYPAFQRFVVIILLHLRILKAISETPRLYGTIFNEKSTCLTP